MQFSGLLRWGLWSMLLCLFGCSSLHVDVAPSVDWNTVSDVTLLAPPKDPWLLAPKIRKQLQHMGMTVLEAGDGDPDLVVRFFTQEGPDLDVDGNMLTRLQSLHVQFVDPSNETVVAVVDYFYPDRSFATDKGVEAAFAGFYEKLQDGRAPQVESSSQPLSAPDLVSTSNDSTAKPGLTQPVEPLTPAPESARLPENMVPSEVEKNSLTQPLETAETAPVSVVETPETSLVPVLEKPETTPAPVLEKPKVRELESKTQSPWIPKFKSWGFEHWGEQSSDGY